MRKSDKKKNFLKVNLLAEQRYLQSKGIVTESFHDADGTPIGVDKNHMPIKENNEMDLETNPALLNNIIQQMADIVAPYIGIDLADKSVANHNWEAILTAFNQRFSRNSKYKDEFGKEYSKPSLEEDDLINENNSLEKDYFMYEGEIYRPGKLLLEPKINDDSLEVKFGLEIKKFSVEKGAYWAPIGGQLIYYLKGKQTGNYANDKNLEDVLIFVDSRYQKKVDAKNFKIIGNENSPLIDGIRFYVNTEITKIWK